MRNFCFAAIIALSMTTARAAAQVMRNDSPHTVVSLAAPDPGGEASVTLSLHREIGDVTRGTANQRKPAMPGDSAIVAPDGVYDSPSKPNPCIGITSAKLGFCADQSSADRRLAAQRTQ
jgi:hypothetical protein